MISAIIIILILSIGFVISVYIEKPHERSRIPEYFAIALFACMIIGVAILFELEATNNTYKDGFIDAKIGEQTYILETQPDSTRIWVKND